MSRGDLSDAQREAIAVAKRLDTLERSQRRKLEATREELRAAVAAALNEHHVPVTRLADAINRDRPALYRWRDQASSKRDSARA
jgi:hypothetical protein